MPVGELEPVRAALLEGVARGEPLAHDALEPLLEGRGVQHRPVVVRRRHLPAAQVEVGEPGAPLVQRQAGEVGAVETQQVEDHERRRQRAGQPLGGARAAYVQAFLEHPEVGHPRLVEHDHLAVDEQVARAELAVDHVGPRDADLVGVAAPQPGGAAVRGGQVGEDAHAVPLHLVRPLRAGGQAAGLGREHRARRWHAPILPEPVADRAHPGDDERASHPSHWWGARAGARRQEGS